MVGGIDQGVVERGRHGERREGRVEGRRRWGGGARGEPELVAVVGVALGTEEEAVVGVVLLLLADHCLELRAVLGSILDELVDALVELGVGRRGRGGVEGGKEGRGGKEVRGEIGRRGLLLLLLLLEMEERVGMVGKVRMGEEVLLLLWGVWLLLRG